MWLFWSQVEDGTFKLKRNYLRFDPEHSGFALFQWGRDSWSGVTSFSPSHDRVASRRRYIEKQRQGALLYRRVVEEE